MAGPGADRRFVAAAMGFVFVRRGHALTEKDSILITDFVNTTADPVFDGTLKKLYRSIWGSRRI